jgi:sulfate transport system ATP-binding protein
MGFVGPVTRLDGAYVRPHDVVLHRAAGDPARRAAVVDRVTLLGFEVRVELHLLDGHQLWVQITRNKLAEQPLEIGQRVYVEVLRARRFTSHAA